MRKLKPIFIFFVLIVVLLSVTSCTNKPIKIGFIGSLTSKNSQLSIDARNAIMLGVDEVNNDGGIHGRMIELVIKDDMADPSVALQMHESFVNENVKLVIGHMTSNMSEAVLQSQSENLLFISPTMGSSNATGRDDYFIRTSPLTDNQALTFFELVDQLKIGSAVILYDMMNAEYTEKMASYAQVINQSSRNISLKLIPFDSRVDDLKIVANQVLSEKGVELVLLISQAIDTAVVSQILKREQPDLTLCSVSWSMTEDLLLNGGEAIKDMYFIGLNKAQNPSEDYKRFQKAFFEKYQYDPSFVSVLAYDAFYVLVNALNATKDESPVKVKQALLTIGEYSGLEETFVIDAYGDNNRSYLLYQLKDNRFIPLYK